MNDIFDINLLSQIQALDRKFSVDKENSRLRRKRGTDDHKHKGYHNESQTLKTTTNNKEDDSIGEIESIHTNIDITV